MYDKLTEHKIVKYCLLGQLATFFPLLMIAILLATVTGPEGYFIFVNTLSELGSEKHTLFPFLFDASLIIGGIFMIPVTLYLERYLAPVEDVLQMRAPRVRMRLASYGFLLHLFSNIGMILVGIFSVQRDPDLIVHTIAAIFAFGCLIFGGMFYGVLFVFTKSKSKIPKIVGIYGIFGPITIGIGTPVIMIVIGLTLVSLLEWIIFFSVLAWLILIGFILLNHDRFLSK